MAIKVKHEGNATSRLMAAGAGGKGRRRAEDAKWLTQIASQENMANRRVAEPRFIQAHAQGPSSAPLVQAHAGGGSAPLMGAPGISQPHPLPSRGTTFSPVTSPGGFKKGRRGQGGGAAAAGGRGGNAAGGAMPGNLVQVKQGPNPAWELRDDKGQTIRKYSEAQMLNVVGRGDLGSTMDDIDQQAWFRFRGGKTEQELAEEQAQQKAAAEQDRRAADAAEWDRREGVRDAREKERIDARQTARDKAARDKAEADRIDFIRRGRLAEGYDYKQVLELEDLDRQLQEAKANQDLPEAEYNSQIAEIEDQINGMVPKNRELTSQGRKEMSALRNEFIKNFKDFNPAELPELYKSLGFAEELITAMDALREHEPTAQEQFDKRKVTVNGVEGYIGAKGDFIPFDDGTAAAKKEEFDAKRNDALQSRADKFELELRKPYTVTEDNGYGEPVKKTVMRSEEEIEALMRKKFPDLYPAAPESTEAPAQTSEVASPAAGPTQTNTASDPDDPLSAFKQFKD